MAPAPELLLRDAAWLRALTRKLAGDADLAAELQQDVALAALSQPAPAELGRSWLAAVAHNLAALLRRRRGRELARLQRLPAPEPAPSPDALAAEAELQQRAVAAMLALPAPYRDTVLLRFMHGLSVQATAAAMRVPEETVRTRQRRALAMLRAALRPGRGECRGAVLLLARFASWGVAMKLKHVVATAAVLLVGLLAVVPLWSSRPAPPPAMAPLAAPAVAGASLPGAEAPPAAGVAATRTEVAASAGAAVASGASLTVRVLWKDEGAAAAGVPVLCRGAADTGSFADTDAHGEVCFAELEAGVLELCLQDWQSESVTLAAGEHRLVQFQLDRGRRVRGIVLGVEGAPVPDATILVSSGGTSPQWRFPVARSDAQGRFSCAGLRTYSLLGASHPDRGTSEFLMLMGDLGKVLPAEVALRLPAKGVELRGRVVDDLGRALPGAWVEIGRFAARSRRDDDGRRWESPPPWLGTTAADGAFTAQALPLGEQPVLVYHRGLAPHRQVLQLDADVPMWTVVLQPGGALVGSVRDAAGNAIAGADVELEPYDHPRCCSQDTAADGTFRFEEVPAGEVTLKITAAGFPRQQRTITFHGGETQSVDAVLQVGAAIRGRLVDEQGLPLAAWWIGLAGGERRDKTDRDGRFVLADCGAGDNELVVRERTGFVPERLRLRQVQPQEAEQTFVVPAASAPSAQLRGRCVGPDGELLADARLHVEQSGWPIRLDGDHCAADGSFEVGPLPPGSYRLLPQHAQFVFAPVAATLRARGQLDLGVLRGARPARLAVRLVGEASACAGASVELVGGESDCRGEGAGNERRFPRVWPGRYRIVVHRGGHEMDGGEVELGPGAELARDVMLR